MGYREDVVVVVSKNGWENLINAISPNSDLLDQKKAQLVHNVPVSKVLDIAKRLNTLKLPTFWQF